MADFLSNKKVLSGFVALNKSELVLGAVVSDEIDPTMLLDFECIKVKDNPGVNREILDQDLRVEDALRMSKFLDVDFTHTKRLKKRKTQANKRAKTRPTSDTDSTPSMPSPLSVEPSPFELSGEEFN